MNKKELKEKLKSLDARNFYSKKWLVLVCLSIFLIIFGRIIITPSLVETAIILGLGIDITDTQQFKITAQMSVLTGGADGASPKSYVNITEEGNTISQALDRIGQRLGLEISLAHCNIVILSEKALKLNHFQLFYPLSNFQSLPIQSIIFTGAESPEDLLNVRLEPFVAIPFYLQNAISQNVGSNGYIRISVKNFLCSSTSRSNGLVVPYIETVELDKPPINENEEIKGYKKVIINKTIAVSNDKTALLDERLTRAAVVYNSDKMIGTLNVKLEDGSTVEFKIIKRDKKTKAKGYNVNTEIEFILSFNDAQFVSDNNLLRGTSEISKEGAKILEKELTKDISDCFKQSQILGIDFLNIEDTIYRYLGRNCEKDCLSKSSLTPKIKIKIKENH